MVGVGSRYQHQGIVLGSNLCVVGFFEVEVIV